MIHGRRVPVRPRPGLNNVAYGLIMQELERGDSGLRSFASVQSGLVMFPIYSYGWKEQKDFWIPKLATGEKVGCFGLTEPDFGSNPGGMHTHARRDGNSWVLNGAKAWITNGSIADVAVVWAKAEGTIRGFLVTWHHETRDSISAALPIPQRFRSWFERPKGDNSRQTRSKWGVAVAEQK